MRISTLSDGTLRSALELRYEREAALRRRLAIPISVLRLVSRAAEMKYRNG